MNLYTPYMYSNTLYFATKAFCFDTYASQLIMSFLMSLLFFAILSSVVKLLYAAVSYYAAIRLVAKMSIAKKFTKKIPRTDKML